MSKHIRLFLHRFTINQSPFHQQGGWHQYEFPPANTPLGRFAAAYTSAQVGNNTLVFMFGGSTSEK